MPTSTPTGVRSPLQIVEAAEAALLEAHRDRVAAYRSVVDATRERLHAARSGVRIGAAGDANATKPGDLPRGGSSAPA